MEVHCYTDTTTTNLMGELSGFGNVWYHPYSITNILSISQTKAKYWVRFNSKAKNAFIFHKDKDKEHTFIQSPQGPYYLDITKRKEKTDHVLINIVKDKKTKYSNADIKRA